MIPPTKADFVAVLAAVQADQPLTPHQINIVIAALQRAADMPGQAAASGKSEIIRSAPIAWYSLLPALLAKMEESCDLQREVRDMMRRKNPPHTRAHDFGMRYGMGQAEPGRSPPSERPDQRAGSASPIPTPKE